MNTIFKKAQGCVVCNASWVAVGVASLLLVLSSYYFNRTDGLLVVGYFGGDEVTYVNTLMSSGSDDDVSIEVGKIIFSIAFVVMIVSRLLRKSGAGVVVLLSMPAILQAIFLMMVEAGSLLDTIFVGKNYVLLIWVVSLIAYVASVLSLPFSSKFTNR